MLLVIVVAVAGPGIAPHGKDDVISIPNPKYDLDSFESDALSETTVAILATPSWDHPFGTDHLGRDLLSRMLYGARTALIVGVGAAFLAAVAGTTIAIVSGYLGGLVDLLIQRVVDAVIAIPGLIILLLLVQAGERSLTLTVVALATLGTFGTSRVIRSAVLSIRSSVFVEGSADARGESRPNHGPARRPQSGRTDHRRILDIDRCEHPRGSRPRVLEPERPWSQLGCHSESGSGIHRDETHDESRGRWGRSR